MACGFARYCDTTVERAQTSFPDCDFLKNFLIEIVGYFFGSENQWSRCKPQTPNPDWPSYFRNLNICRASAVLLPYLYWFINQSARPHLTKAFTQRVGGVHIVPSVYEATELEILTATESANHAELSEANRLAASHFNLLHQAHRSRALKMASELASTVQSLSLKDQPSVEHDVNPSTAASEKFPADLVPSQDEDLSTEDQDDDDDASSHTSSTSTIPSDIVRPIPRQPPRRHHLPLPDLRFEQTYLASLKNADTTGKVVYITIRDQVLLPLLQGVGYHLLISGWRYWNRASKFTGQTLGTRIRIWWWRLNSWPIPQDIKKS